MLMPPKATMAAEVGAAAHCGRFISAGAPGVDWGSMLFETTSKMPALVRSLKSVVSKVCFSVTVCGAGESGLKSATAMRMLVTPLDVSVLNQSWACREAEDTSRKKRTARQES